MKGRGEKNVLAWKSKLKRWDLSKVTARSIYLIYSSPVRLSKLSQDKGP
jgi:hypothetical protein